jgi:hypothetical protein
MGVKGYSLLGYLTKLSKRKYLESTRVRKNRSVPVKELVKAAHTVDKIVSRTDVKMISVGKLYLAVNLFKIHGRDTALNCGRGSNVHKHRGLNSTVNGLKSSTASLSLCFK